MTGTGLLDRASPMLMAALAVRFLLELALLVGAATLAWNLTDGGWRWPAAIVAVVAVGTVWALFLSPRAAVILPGPAVLAIEAALFLGTAAGLLLVGLGVPAVVGCVIWALNRIAIALLQS